MIIRNITFICKCRRFHINDVVHRYDLHEREAFTVRSRNHSYTREFKESVVQEYLNGYGLLKDIAAKYNPSLPPKIGQKNKKDSD